MDMFRNKSRYLKIVIQCYAVHVQVEGFKPTFFTSQNPYQPCKPPIHEGSMVISLVKSIIKIMMSLYFVVALLCFYLKNVVDPNHRNTLTCS